MALTKVKGVQASGSFENQYGSVQDNPELPNHGKTLLYKFEYVMEDGTVITANHKFPEGNFKQGDSVEYEIKKDDPQYGKSGKVTKPGAGNFGGKTNPSQPFKGGVGEDLRQLMIVRQSSLNRAIEVLIHNSKDAPVSIGDAEMLGQRFTDWVMQPEPQPEKVQQLAQTATEALMNEPQ